MESLESIPLRVYLEISFRTQDLELFARIFQLCACPLMQTLQIVELAVQLRQLIAHLYISPRVTTVRQNLKDS
jgi:hypothetical protein